MKIHPPILRRGWRRRFLGEEVSHMQPRLTCEEKRSRSVKSDLSHVGKTRIRASLHGLIAQKWISNLSGSFVARQKYEYSFSYVKNMSCIASSGKIFYFDNFSKCGGEEKSLSVVREKSPVVFYRSGSTLFPLQQSHKAYFSEKILDAKWFFYQL